MKIEDSIQQKQSFRNAYHKAIVNLIYTNYWVLEKLKKHLKPYGITMQQYNVLRILDGAKKPLSTCIIRRRLIDKMSDASRLVLRLSQKGLVSREPSINDKRYVDVRLTTEGLELLKKVESCVECVDNILVNLNEEEAMLLSNLLDKARLHENPHKNC